MRLAILMSSGAGRVDLAACEERVLQIRSAFDALGVRPEIPLCSPAQLTRAVRMLATRTRDAVVAAGGDGTIGAVAAGLACTTMPLAVLPSRTLDHFAKDLGMQLEKRHVTEVSVRSKKRSPVALGGEVVRSAPPLSCGVRPGALLERRAQHDGRARAAAADIVMGASR